MGINPKKLKKGDRLILGMSNRLKLWKGYDGYLLFGEIETPPIKDKLTEFINYWERTHKDNSLIIYGKNNRYHIVGLNAYNEKEILQIYIDNINILDRQHIAYSILKGFATLRISKKNKKEKLNDIYYFNYGQKGYAKSMKHYCLIRAICNINNNFIIGNKEFIINEHELIDMGLEFICYGLKKKSTDSKE